MYHHFHYFLVKIKEKEVIILFQFLTESKDPYNSFKKLLSPTYWRIVKHLIIDTRQYEEGLLFVDRMFTLLDLYKHRCNENEFINYEQHLTYFKMILLDKSDRWHRFVEMYEQLDPDRYSILKSRYEVIQKKINRQAQGENVEHLKHKPSLPEGETQRRIKFIMKKLESGNIPNWWGH